MKKRLAPRILTALVLAVALIVLAPPVLRAGDYHYRTTLLCQECHVMHFSQAHDYGDSSGFATLGPTGPYEKLLRNEVNDLCLTCHNDQLTIADVLDSNSKTTVTVRQAGALSRGTEGAGVPTGHTLDSTEAAPNSDPGTGWSNPDGFSCVDCHDPHGEVGGAVDVFSINGIEEDYPDLGVYRNLATNIGTAGTYVNVSYAVGTRDPNRDVFERTAPRSYNVTDVDFNEPVPDRSGMSEWCKQCHPNFHGNKGGPEVGGAIGTEWLRHPSADANIGAQGGTHSSLSLYSSYTNKVKVMDPSGTWDGSSSEVTPFCLSCHKAHGNQNAFGLVYMSGEGDVTEEGDDGTTVTALCHQCHVQGVPPPGP